MKYCKLRKTSNLIAVICLTIFLAAGTIAPASTAQAPSAIASLEKLPVKGKAPKTGYERNLFSDGWGQIGNCTVRNYILKRDMKAIKFREGCTVESGQLQDPYTGQLINFKYGVGTSSAVQIDHVVSLSDAWQKGAQQIGAKARYSLYNDPLNLLAVDGPTNSSKGDKDASAWLPPNKSYRCAFVARQVAVKIKYKLWVIQAEKDAIKRILQACPKQLLPTS